MTTIELSPTPLPHEPPPYDGRHEHRPDYLRAYDLTLDAERYSDEQTEANPSNQEAKHNLMFARVAGYFLLEFSNRWTILSETPYVSLVEQIISPPRDGDTVHDVVFGVGRWYFNHLLLRSPAETLRYQTPESLPISPLPFDTLAQMADHYMEADGRDYRTARHKALVRDGFRCMLTGMYDDISLKRNPELCQQCCRLGSCSADVDTCHILDELTVQGIMSNEAGFGNLAEELAAEGVNGLGNILSLDPNLHVRLNNLDLWFEATEETNRYNVFVSHLLYENYVRLHGHLRDDCGRLSVTFPSNISKTIELLWRWV